MYIKKLYIYIKNYIYIYIYIIIINLWFHWDYIFSYEFSKYYYFIILSNYFIPVQLGTEKIPCLLIYRVLIFRVFGKRKKTYTVAALNIDP